MSYIKSNPEITDTYFIEELRPGLEHWIRTGGQYANQSYESIEKAIGDIRPRSRVQYRIAKQSQETIKVEFDNI